MEIGDKVKKIGNETVLKIIAIDDKVTFLKAKTMDLETEEAIEDSLTIKGPISDFEAVN